MPEFINVVQEFGPLGVLLGVLFLLIQDPNRAEKLKALLLQPTYQLFRWGSRQYLASKVGSTTTAFFQQYLKNYLSGVDNVKVSIKWVTSPSDPILSEDGTLILCLQETDDQTRNILTATRVALPHVVCPFVRPHLKPNVQTAIDLALLRKLAEGLGKHAKLAFQKYFLDPEMAGDPEAAELFTKLVEIDTKGIFVSIFLEELYALGEGLYKAADNFKDETDEIKEFLEFLLVLARRDLGEDVPLQYVSQDIRVGIVLVAKTATAETKGVSPYLRAIDLNIKRGCNSIYLVGYAHAKGFLGRVLSAAEGDERLLVMRGIKRIVVSSDIFSWHEMYIALLQVNSMFAEATFEERLAISGLKLGDIVEGTVIDASKDAALVDAKGFQCSVLRGESSWYTVLDCSNALNEEARYKFKIVSIASARGTIELSRKVADEDPWAVASVPEIGDQIDVDVVFINGNHCVSRYNNAIEVIIPIEEVSWFSFDRDGAKNLVGKRSRIVVLSKDEQQRTLGGSIRQVAADPWPQIHASLPRGTEIRGVAVGIEAGGVMVRLPSGLITLVPRDSLVRAGFEYADFENSVVVGQGLDLVVTKVFVAKRKIRVDLKRNLNK